MKGTALLLLCAATLVRADQPQLTRSGTVCNCNPAEAVSVCKKNGSDNQLIVHENCNQFYKCSYGSPVAFYCPDNLLYNSLAEVCDWPINVQCGERPIVTPDAESGDCDGDNSNDSNEGAGAQDNNNDDGSNDGNNVVNCYCNPEDAPGICAAEGSSGVLVAHQYCNRFYKCDHGVAAVLNCPSGLLYNPYTEQCDWAHKVDCGDRPVAEIEDGGGNGGDHDCEENENEDNDGDNKGTCNCNPGEAPSICAAKGSDGVLVAHENCNQFYKCDHGSPVVLNCPPNLLYNPYTEQCDWTDKVDCGDRPIVEIENGGNNDGADCDNSENNQVSGGGNNEGNSGSGTCNCDPGAAGGICASSGSEGYLIAHENCNQFYKCSNGVPIALFCSIGLVYNPYNESCDWPTNVDCGGKPIVEVEGGNNGGGDGDNNGNGGSGGNGTCNCDPGAAPGICAAGGSDGTLIAHENCNQFYKCAHGIPIAMFCGQGLVYNPFIERCDWPANVECGDKPIVEIEGGNNGGGDGDDNGNGGSGGNGSCNCDPGAAPGICASAGSDGTLIAHENCNQFYKCAHGVPVGLFCGQGLVYNPIIERCDWPANVNCGDRPIVDIGSGDNGSGETSGEGNGNGSGDGGEGDNGGSGSCNCDPGAAPGICATDGSDGTLIAHENCNQFYKCANGIPVALFCSEGLLYNPYIERCDWPANVDCGDKPIAEIECGDNGNNETSTESNEGGDNNGNGTCNCDPGEAPGICAADGSEGTLIAHENCNQFYKCANGIPVALFCSEGLVYNPFIERCDWPANVNCGDKPIVEIGGGDNGSGETSGEGNGNGSGGGGESDNGGSSSCNCDPGAAPGICATDGSDGFLIAHENCNQFYKCANGIPVALFCSEGLLYNPFIERCDWPENVNCGDRPIVEIEIGNNGNGNNETTTDSNEGGDNNGNGTCNCDPGAAPGICAADGSEGTLIAHENCNQFYKCANGIPVALFCSEGLLYNPFIERCDWPENVNCGDRPIVEIESGNNGNGNNETTTDSNEGGDNNGNGTCNCDPGAAPGICAADGSEGTLIAHENCNQFYKCANSIPVALFCSEGLLYNPFIERCDWPENVNCGDRPIVEIESGNNGNGNNETTTDSNEGGDNNGNGTCNCDPGAAPGICAADGSEGTLIAHENCNQFYKCANGIPVALFCSEGLLYNPFIERCDWPENVSCGDRPIVEIESGNNGNGNNETTTDSNEGGDNNGNGTCNCDPGAAPGICAADGSEGTLIAHENCNQFYKCANGIPVALFCSEGLLYNPFIERCDWPENVNCGDRPIVEIESGNNGNGNNETTTDSNEGGDNNGNGTCNCDPGAAPGICAADGSDGTLIAHENCNQFYKCANGIPVAIFCNENLLYDPNTERCDWSENVNCEIRPIIEREENSSNEDDCDGHNNDSDCNCDPNDAARICASAGSDGTLIAHENCNQFYKCTHNLPVPQFCASGLVYNTLIQRCDWPANFDCKDKPIVEREEEDNDDSENTDENEDDNEDGDSDNTCNCNPEEAPAICASAGSDGTFVAHENCNQFYRCVHGINVAQFCANGLVYNPYIRRCDWPVNVDCGNKPIVEVEGDKEDENENNNGQNNCDPSQAPEICAATGSEGVLVAHEECDKFYVCNFGRPLAVNCPANLLYNPSIEDCDWPKNVDCGDRTIPGTEDVEGPCACSAKEAPAICADNESTGKLIAHENCNQYYVCFAGAPVARSCPLSLFYDPHTEQCLWPASVDCEGRAVSTYTSLNKHSQARRGFF